MNDTEALTQQKIDGERPAILRILRSVGAVFAGFLVVVLLSIGTDAAMRAANIFPALTQPMGNGLLLLATAYRTIYGIAGNYGMALLAPSHPMKHALAGGVIGLILTTLGAVTTWNQGLGPHWYPIALIVTALPCAWIGGYLRLMQMRFDITHHDSRNS